MIIVNDTGNPLVSVLMTAYNREKYIAEAIVSVINSTYQNWELIIVDDCSKDRTVEIAKSYEVKDERIRVYINERNLGDYPNRNKAASYARGKYLKYVDADDLIYPYGLELLVYYMEQYPEAGYGLCSLGQDKQRIYPFLLSPEKAYRRHYFESSLFHKAPLSSIIRKEVFDQVGGYSGKRMLGDFEMWHLISQKYSVLLMPQGIVWYREHDDQEMSLHKKDPLEPFKYFLVSKEFISSSECPLKLSERTILLNRIQRLKSKLILSAAKRHSIKKALELKALTTLGWFMILKRALLR